VRLLKIEKVCKRHIQLANTSAKLQGAVGANIYHTNNNCTIHICDVQSIMYNQDPLVECAKYETKSSSLHETELKRV